MRFSLRTLLILMLLAGPFSALLGKQWLAYQEQMARAEAAQLEAALATYRRNGQPSPRATYNFIHDCRPIEPGPESEQRIAELNRLMSSSGLKERRDGHLPKTRVPY
jgi:hypothetical protein